MCRGGPSAARGAGTGGRAPPRPARPAGGGVRGGAGAARLARRRPPAAGDRRRASRAAADSVYTAFENRFRGSARTSGSASRDAELFRGLDSRRRPRLRARGVPGASCARRASPPGAWRATRTSRASAGRRGSTWSRATSWTSSRAGRGSLGGVFAAQVAEHLPPPCSGRLLAEAHRALRPGGLLLLETANPRSVLGLLEVFNRDLTHERPLHPDTLRFLVAAAGFTDVRSRCARRSIPRGSSRRCRRRGFRRLRPPLSTTTWGASTPFSTARSSTRSSRGASQGLAARLRLAPPAGLDRRSPTTPPTCSSSSPGATRSTSSTRRRRSTPRGSPRARRSSPPPSSWPATASAPTTSPCTRWATGGPTTSSTTCSRGCPACSCSTTSCCTTRGRRSSSSPRRSSPGAATRRAPRRARPLAPRSTRGGGARVLVPGPGRPALRSPPRHRGRPAALRLPALPDPRGGLARGGRPQRVHGRAIRAEVPGRPRSWRCPSRPGGSRSPPERVRALRARLGFREDEVVVGSFGLVTPEKRTADLARAVARAAARDPRLRLLLVGPVPDSARARGAPRADRSWGARRASPAGSPSKSSPPTWRPPTWSCTCATPPRARPRARSCACWPRAGPPSSPTSSTRPTSPSKRSSGSASRTRRAPRPAPSCAWPAIPTARPAGRAAAAHVRRAHCPSRVGDAWEKVLDGRARSRTRRPGTGRRTGPEIDSGSGPGAPRAHRHRGGARRGAGRGARSAPQCRAGDRAARAAPPAPLPRTGPGPRERRHPRGTRRPPASRR